MEKLIVQPVKTLSTFCGTEGFIAVLTTGQYHSQTNPFTTFSFYLRFLLILSSHLQLGIPSGVFPLLYVFLFFPTQETPLISFIENCTKSHNCISCWWNHQRSVHSRSMLLTKPHGEAYPCSCVAHCCNLACQYIQNIWADKVLECCRPSI